jgi:hypothetical protein
VIFALAVVLPLLVFIWTLHRFEVMDRFEVQLSLALALTVSLLGLSIFRVMMGRTSQMIYCAVRVVETRTMLAEAGLGAVSEAVTRAARRVPGIGAIRELRSMAQTMDHLKSVWKAEATPLVGRRVLVSVRNSTQPIAGTLVQVTDDGVMLDDQSGAQVAVSYSRISTIELDRSPASPPRPWRRTQRTRPRSNRSLLASNGAQRSPTFFTRAGTVSIRKSSVATPRSSSRHLTGVDTVARGRGRTE